MAVNIIKTNGRITYGINDFLCDLESDVKDLKTDCAVGSKAYIIENGKTYILNGSKQWKEMKNKNNNWTPTEEQLEDIKQQILNDLPRAEEEEY